jgi:hypothetical protein
MLQQSGNYAANINQLIINGLIKSPKFALFRAVGKPFHFKPGFRVKKLVSSHHFCPKSGVFAVGEGHVDLFSEMYFSFAINRPFIGTVVLCRLRLTHL